MRETYTIREGRIISSITLAPGPEVGLGQDSYYIAKVYTFTPFRGLGFARTLMNQLLQDADEEGIALYLEVGPDGGLSAGELRAWYSRCGFSYWADGLWRREPKVPTSC